jgi:hypothetical protein
MNLRIVGGNTTGDLHENVWHETAVISENEEILNEFTMT